MAPRTGAGTASGELFSSGLQCSSCARPTDLAEQESSFQAPVRSQLGHITRSSGRSQTPRRRTWLPQHPSYLGPDAAGSPSHPLCRTRRRIVRRSQSVDFVAIPLLPTGQGAQPRIPRQVRRWFEASLPSQETGFSRSLPTAIERKSVRPVSAHPVSPGLGGLLQTTLWRSETCAAVSGSLYPSSSDLQSPDQRHDRYARDIPMEGLRSSQQAARDDFGSRGVSAPISPARLAERLPAHPLLRIPSQSSAGSAASAVPGLAVQISSGP